MVNSTSEKDFLQIFLAIFCLLCRLLRSVSHPACLHDLLWCFVAALEANTNSATNGVNMNDEKAAKEKKNKKLESALSQKGIV